MLDNDVYLKWNGLMLFFSAFFLLVMASQSQWDPNLKEAIQTTLRAVALSTVRANHLPQRGDTYELYAADQTFNELLHTENERVMTLIKRIYTHAGCQLPKEFFDSRLDNEERIQLLVDANDALLERIGRSLDDAEGLNRTSVSLEGPVRGQRLRAPDYILKKLGAPVQQSGQSKTSVIEKPQLPGIDNSTNLFRIKLKYKHNPITKSARNNLSIIDDPGASDNGEKKYWSSDSGSSSHPYQPELDSWRPYPMQLEPNRNSQKPKSLEDTKLELIDTAEKLQTLCQLLKDSREFAVDLEHHDYRSYLGITCLVQISTRDADFIIDPFPLWTEMHVLNDPFTDPKIVKIFHGAGTGDVHWLQRDFGIYVVNMFDTGIAMRQLQFVKFSLQHLVAHVCGVTLDKQYQTRDWRIRPLPSEMLTYARSDTHYLLHCYDVLKNQLLDQSDNKDSTLLVKVLMDSKLICAMQYTKPVFDASQSAKDIARQSGHRFDARQMQALTQLCAWRDRVARTEDESPQFVLRMHQMLQMALALPRETQGIHALCSPCPPLIKRDIAVLQRILNEARDKVAENDNEQRTTLVAFVRQPVPWLYDTHDYSHTKSDEEMRPAVIYDQDDYDGATTPEQDVPRRRSHIEIFDNTRRRNTRMVSTTDELQQTSTSSSTLIDDWIAPYEQYQLAIMATSGVQDGQRNKKKTNINADDSSLKRYTHKDASSGVGNKPTSYPKPVTLGSQADTNAKYEGPRFMFTEEELMTKAALKKSKRAKVHQPADINIDKHGAKSKKRKIGDVNVAGVSDDNELTESFDFEQARRELANSQKPKTQTVKSERDVYDPFHSLGASTKAPHGKQPRGKTRMGSKRATFAGQRKNTKNNPGKF